jgi:hypothetical protein
MAKVAVAINSSLDIGSSVLPIAALFILALDYILPAAPWLGCVVVGKEPFAALATGLACHEKAVKM